MTCSCSHRHLYIPYLQLPVISPKIQALTCPADFIDITLLFQFVLTCTTRDKYIKKNRGGARFSAPVQTVPGALPTSCTMRTGSFPGVKSGRGVTMAPHHLLVPWSRKSRAIRLLPYGPYGLYWASVPVHGCTLFFTFYLKEKKLYTKNCSVFKIAGPSRLEESEGFTKYKVFITFYPILMYCIVHLWTANTELKIAVFQYYYFSMAQQPPVGQGLLVI